MEYLLCIVATAILIALYKFFPNKKIFSYFCIFLCMVFAMSAYINNRHAEKIEVSHEQIETIRNQQKIFSDWYADYQKNIDGLDRIWQIYFDFTDTLKTAKIYEQKDFLQISELEIEAIDEQIKIHNLKVPEKLDDDCKKILSEVIRKTQIYSDAQVKTISAVKNISNPDSVKSLEDLNKKIKNITIRESPTGLFTANEILQIREILTVPEEVDKIEKLPDNPK